jgi:hypothetical protein
MTMDHLSSTIPLSALVIAATFSGSAAAVIGSNAEVVQLSQSCTENGAPVDNCFTTIASLDTWIWGTRNPSSTAPLRVDIGPGTFEGLLTCNNSGYVSYRGSGMGITVIRNQTIGPVSVDGCVNMKFSNLTMQNYGSILGIRWMNGGSSVWHNVELDMVGYGWWEGAGSGCAWEPGTHYWFGSRLTSRTAGLGGGAVAYYATCDVSWFIGSEMTGIGDTSASGVVHPVRAPGGELHFYGSVIRALSEPGVTTDLTAVEAMAGGEVHIHGTGIDVISAEGNDITSLAVLDSTGTIHANQASFVMKTGAGGSKTRIVNNGGTVRAPYLWEKGTTPPAISSQNGSDMAVITNTTDGQPHLLIYSDNCPSNWFDTVTATCS